MGNEGGEMDVMSLQMTRRHSDLLPKQPRIANIGDPIGEPAGPQLPTYPMFNGMLHARRCTLFHPSLPPRVRTNDVAWSYLVLDVTTTGSVHGYNCQPSEGGLKQATLVSRCLEHRRQTGGIGVEVEKRLNGRVRHSR
jgi:hypothetical protein